MLNIDWAALDRGEEEKGGGNGGGGKRWVGWGRKGKRRRRGERRGGKGHPQIFTWIDAYICTFI